MLHFECDLPFDVEIYPNLKNIDEYLPTKEYIIVFA